jgi:hypothetical protein
MAGNVMRSSQFKSVVEPILNEVFDGVYDQRKDEYKSIFDQKDGIARAYHEEALLFGFQTAPELPDGMPVTYDEAGVLYNTRYPYKVYGLAFALTQVLVEDGDHVRIGSIYSKHLAQSMDETIETVHANVVNRAFTSGYNGGDGVTLVSASHPVIGGTQSNLLTSAALSQTSLEQALTTIRKTKDPRGKYVRLVADELVVDPTNMLNAEVILTSVLRAGTANNDVNPIKSLGMIGNGSVVMSRLTSSTAWFIHTNADQGLQTFWRRRVNKGMEGDFETDSMRYKSTMRWAAGWTEWRSLFGSAGV